MANVLNLELECLETEQGPGMGGAMLAMVACGEFADVASACDRFVRVASRVKPQKELAERYEAKYQQFRKIYPACRELFRQMQA